MNQEMIEWKTDLDPKNLKNTSSFLATENRKKGVPIPWEVIQTEYDSGPKMGID